MKRFFFVFSIILIVFLLIAAGTIAAVDYGSIKVTSINPVFVAGWGITLIPYSTTYPASDAMLIRQASARDVKQGDVILYTGGTNWLVKSGSVAVVGEQGLSVVRSDGASSDILPADVKGLYKGSLPHFSDILGLLKSMLAIGIFATLLILSIVLWFLLPGTVHKRIEGRLSASDGEIATNLNQ